MNSRPTTPTPRTIGNGVIVDGPQEEDGSSVADECRQRLRRDFASAILWKALTMSKASRRRSKGSSKAGRPRKEGDRYPSGKLKPPAPNAELLARRKAGDASAGEHPLDFALSRNWITEREHRDAAAYRTVFNRAHIGGIGPRLALSKYGEDEPSESLRKKWAELSDDYITAIFDKVFNGEPMPEDVERAEATALARWKVLNAALTAPEREELFMVCVLGSWPFWMPKKASDRAMGSKDVLKEASLMNALGAIGRAMRPPKPKEAVIASLPFRRTRAGRSEEGVRYETEDGIEVTPTSEHGAPFEVTVLRKRA